MAILTAATMPVVAAFDDSGEVGATTRYAVTQFNQLMKQQAALALAFTSDGVLKGTALSIGTTVTLATAQCIITIAGVPVSVPATTAQAFGSLGTIPTATWGIIAVDAVAAGTISFASGAANYTTGYATEALAVAAAPAKTANKARIGYLTILATTPGWVAGTDALAGGTGGTPATTTNYYNIASPWQLTADSANAITLGSIAFTASSIGNMNTTVASVITT